MSQRRALSNLYEELRTIDVFDRIHEYAPDGDPANERLHATRAMRRKEVIEEIAKLTARKPERWKPAGLSAAIAIICTLGYAMVYYSLK